MDEQTRTGSLAWLERLDRSCADAPLLGVLAERMTDEPDSSIFETARVTLLFVLAQTTRRSEKSASPP